MNTLNYSGGCDWAWGCDGEGALRGKEARKRIPVVPPPPHPILEVAPYSPPILAAVFRFGAEVNGRTAE